MQETQHASLKTDDVEMTGISNINVLLGRNGAGKSRFLRSLDSGLSSTPGFNVRYISPERAGVFRKDGNIQNNLENNKDSLRGVRTQNQGGNFKAASATLLHEVELLYLRQLQDTTTIRNDLTRTFKRDRLDKINGLLSNVFIEQQRAEFVFISSSGVQVSPDQISSGESEAVALASEIMHFFEALDKTKFNVLLLDEPDVHLHPDLQSRLAKFIVQQIDDLAADVQPNVAICLATHSTPFVCALSTSSYTSIGTKDFDTSKVQQFAASIHLKKVAPFFGHPLSLCMSNDALLILEGQDDERVWQQASRSSKGRIRLFPVLATSVDQQFELEEFCSSLLVSIYDAPVAYSLRDGDGKTGELEPVGPVIRFRLECYAIENVLVTDECLGILQTTWHDFQQAATAWITQNQSHQYVDEVSALVGAVDRMRMQKIKQIRQLICAIAGSTKPWEVVVGQAIGALDVDHLADTPGSLQDFIGLKAVRSLLGARNRQ